MLRAFVILGLCGFAAAQETAPAPDDPAKVIAALIKDANTA